MGKNRVERWMNPPETVVPSEPAAASDRIATPADTQIDIELIRRAIRQGQPERDIRALRLFFAIGTEWNSGAPSLRAIAKIFSERDLSGKHTAGLAAGLPSLQRACRDVEHLLTPLLSNSIDKQLFATQGPGYPFSGLSDTGKAVWSAVRSYLIGIGVIDEKD